jgi:hypothetical protein
MNTTQNYKTFFLQNFGILEDKLPTDLYNKLYKECLEAKKNNSVMISGLTSPSVPEHFYIEKNIVELNNYIAQLIPKYNNAFNYLSSFNLLSKNVYLGVGKTWINFQKKHEFLPNHTHDGVLSYSIWIKIPYDEKKEKNYKKVNVDVSNLTYPTGIGKFCSFSFSYTNILGEICQQSYEITKKTEGSILMFPSKLTHCVYPFYTSDDDRISISGNVIFDTNKPMTV